MKIFFGKLPNLSVCVAAILCFTLLGMKDALQRGRTFRRRIDTLLQTLLPHFELRPKINSQHRGHAMLSSLLTISGVCKVLSQFRLGPTVISRIANHIEIPCMAMLHGPVFSPCYIYRYDFLDKVRPLYIISGNIIGSAQDMMKGVIYTQLHK